MFCYQKNFFNPTLPVDEQVFYQLVRDKANYALIDGFRQSGDAALKRKLPAFIFQAMFDETGSKTGASGAWRKQAATRLTGLVVMDIDHVENPKALFDKWKELDFGKMGILLVYITPSGKGIKVVFKAHVQWGNLIDNQHRMAEVLGVQVDESCKDASRMSFVCKEEDILYVDKELFTYEDKKFARKFNAQYRNGHSGATGRKAGTVLGEKTLKASPNNSRGFEEPTDQGEPPIEHSETTEQREQKPCLHGLCRVVTELRGTERVPHDNVMGDSFRVENPNQPVTVGTGVAGTHGYYTVTLSASCIACNMYPNF